jgi:hypothetical protein
MDINTDAYREMSGQGELWIDSEGLPRRLALRLELPQQQNGDRSSAMLTIDYLALTAPGWRSPRPALGRTPARGISYRLATHGAALRQLGLICALFLAAGLILVAAARRLSRRRAYMLTVTAVLISMLTVPQLQASTVSAFYKEQDLQQAAAEQERAKAERAEEAQATHKANTWNPHIGPRTSAALENAPLAHLPAAPVAHLPAASPSSADSDGDGLGDTDEERWGSCPSSTSDSDYCDGVANPADSDADGLGDGVEVNDLATLPNSGTATATGSPTPWRSRALFTRARPGTSTPTATTPTKTG